MALLDQTVITTPSNKKTFSKILRHLRGLFSRKRSFETYLVAEKNREQARRAVDRLLKSGGPWPLV